MLQVFLVGLLFSFLGSIPPGTINLSVIQLGLQNQLRGALSFALAATAVEFVYASLAVEFQIFITSNTSITENFQIISALAMMALGIINLSKKRLHEPPQLGQGHRNFKKGLLISVANPLAVPFWVAVTAYLQNHQFIVLTSPYLFWGYLLGISLGTLVLLLLVTQLAQKFRNLFQNNLLVNKLPGLIFVGMGLYTFWS